MGTVIRLPKLGLSDWGEIVEWKVTKGDRVEAGEVIAVLESDKSSVDIEATAGGVVLATYVDCGEEIQIEPGRPIAAVGEEGEPAPEPGTIDSSAASDSTDRKPTPSSDHDSDDDDATAGASSNSKPKVTPKARKAASEHGVDLASVSGTGPSGAVTASDVERYVEEGPHPESAEESGQESSDASRGFTVSEVRERSRLQRTVGERLTRSAREKPHVKGSLAVCIEALERELDDRFGDDAEVSLNDLFLRAVALTLGDHPNFNAVFEDDEYRLVEEINIGYAVDTDRGLVVPVVEGADEFGIRALAKERHRVVESVIDGDYDSEDLRGGTFTVNNVGALGLDSSFSIIDPPQVAILVVGRRRPELFDRNGDVVTERAVTVSLIVDHRVLDGGDAAGFLKTLNQYVEHPSTLF